MLNRRKAMIGWLVYSAAKPMAKRAVQGQAKKSTRKSSGSAKQSKGKGGMGRAVAGIGAAVAVAGGLLFFRSRRSNDEELPPT